MPISEDPIIANKNIKDMQTWLDSASDENAKFLQITTVD